MANLGGPWRLLFTPDNGPAFLIPLPADDIAATTLAQELQVDLHDETHPFGYELTLYSGVTRAWEVRMPAHRSLDGLSRARYARRSEA